MAVGFAVDNPLRTARDRDRNGVMVRRGRGSVHIKALDPTVKVDR